MQVGTGKVAKEHTVKNLANQELTGTQDEWEKCAHSPCALFHWHGIGEYTKWPSLSLVVLNMPMNV
jgi:hypothetical protein